MYKRNRSFSYSIKAKLLYRLYRQNWNIGVTQCPVAEVAGLEGDRKQRIALDNLVWMNETRGAFFADPFVMPSEGDTDRVVIFYEHFDWKSRRGRIDRVLFNTKEGTFGEKSKSFESDYHLSYPFILKHGDRYGFVPEHSQANDLSFFDIDSEGFVSGKQSILPSMPLVDSTIVFWDGLYWMFATHAGQQDNSHLYIYHAPDLFGPWVGHEKNPVKVDKSNARPAGQPIFHRGSLFRPAQDCASHYGAGILINEVKVLTKADFAEEAVAEIRPQPGSSRDFGLHTISSSGNITVIDAGRLQSILHPALDRFSGHCRSG